MGRGRGRRPGAEPAWRLFRHPPWRALPPAAERCVRRSSQRRRLTGMSRPAVPSGVKPTLTLGQKRAGRFLLRGWLVVALVYVVAAGWMSVAPIRSAITHAQRPPVVDPARALPGP